MIASIIIMLVVIIILILALRYYQRVRVNTGYKPGKFYRRGKHMGVFIGNHHMKEIGAEEESRVRKDPDEKMFIYPDSESGN